MNKIKIEKNVEVPNYHFSKWTPTIKKMKVGDSIYFPYEKTARSFYTSAVDYFRRNELDRTVMRRRQIGMPGSRIWVLCKSRVRDIKEGISANLCA